MFCLVTGWKEEDEEVEARDAGWSIVATDMLRCPVSRPARGFVRLDGRIGPSGRGEDELDFPIYSATNRPEALNFSAGTESWWLSVSVAGRTEAGLSLVRCYEVGNSDEWLKDH